MILLVAEERRRDAVHLARRIGYDDLAFLDGGVDTWRAAGLPIGTVEEVGPLEAL